MEKVIKILPNKFCEPQYLFVGYENEKNVDCIVLDVDKSIPNLNWYLAIHDTLIPFLNKKMIIGEELTQRIGMSEAYILGSNATPGQPITSGSIFFSSNKLTLEVGARI